MNSPEYFERFKALVGKEIKAFTVDGECTVVVDDAGRDPYFHVLCVTTAKRYHGTVDSNNVFHEKDLQEKLSKRETEAKAAREVKVAKERAEAAALARMVYAIEVECGGPNASGGGCGAPLEVYTTTKEVFEKMEGVPKRKFFNFFDEELAADILEAKEQGNLSVKYSYRACGGCRNRC